MEWDSLKVERYTIEGLPDPTDVSQNQQTSVGKATKNPPKAQNNPKIRQY